MARDLELALVLKAQVEQFTRAVGKAADDLQRALADMTGEADKAGGKVEDATGRMARSTGGFIDAISKAKAELLALGGAGAGLGLIVKQAVDFEAAMADVKKVVEGTPEQYEALTNQIKELSRELPVSAEGLAQIAAAGGQLGVPIEKIGEFTRLAAQMSVAFNLSAEEAGRAIAKLSNVFDLPIDAVGALGDAINTLGNNTAATEAQIIEALVRIGGTAKQFGLAAEEAAALSASMIALGKSPEVAATGINALLTRLQTATIQGKEFQEGLAQLGLTAEDVARRIQASPQQALEEFLGTLQRLDKQTRAEIIGRLFGQEYADDISALVGAMGQYERAVGLVVDRTRTAGAMQAEFAARMQTTQAQLGLLRNAVEEAAINLGSALLPSLKDAAESVAGLTRAVAEFAEAHPALAQWGTGLALLLGSVRGLEIAFQAMGATGLLEVGKVRGAMALLTGSIKEATVAMGGLRTAGLLGLSAWTGWKIGEWLSDQFETVRKAGIALVSGLVKGAEHVRYAWEVVRAAMTDDTVEAATQRHQERLRQIEATFFEMWQEAEQGAKKAAAATDQAGESAEKAGEKAKEAGEKAGTAFGDAGRQATALQKALDALGVDAVEATTGITKAGRDAADAFATVVQEVKASGKSAEESAKIIEASLGAALKKATSRQDVELLKETIRELGAEGSLAGKELASALGAADKKLQDLAAKTQPTTAAITELKQETKGAKDETDGLSAAVSQAGRTMADLGEKASEAGGLIAQMMRAALEEVRAFGDGAVEQFQRWLAVTGAVVNSWAGLSSAIESAKALTMDYYRRAEGEVGRLVEALSDQETATWRVRREAEEALTRYAYLGEERLEPLRAALEDARQRTEGLRQEAASTLAELRDELDRLRGDQAAIEQRRYEARRAELEARKEEARLAKDHQAQREIDEALRTLEQIHKIRMAQIKAEADAARQRAQEEARYTREVAGRSELPERARAEIESTRPRGTPLEREAQSYARTGEFAPARTYQVRLGDRTTAHFTSDAEAQRFLRLLEEYGIRSA